MWKTNRVSILTEYTLNRETHKYISDYLSVINAVIKEGFMEEVTSKLNLEARGAVSWVKRAQDRD